MKDYVDYDIYVQEDLEREKKETKEEKKSKFVSVSARKFFKGVSGRGIDY